MKNIKIPNKKEENNKEIDQIFGKKEIPRSFQVVKLNK